MLDPIGFWSYTRHDDAHSDGELSQLRVLVGKAMGLQLGAEVKLWQDITAIPFGADWAGEIERTIGKTSFFMPIVTPRFLKSRNCFDEFEQFRKRMRMLGRDDLVFAVHYVSVESMRAEDTIFGDSLTALRRHQWVDFRPLFYADPRSRDVRRWAGNLATSILEALGRPAVATVAANGAASEPAGATDAAEPPSHGSACRLDSEEEATSEVGSRTDETPPAVGVTSAHPPASTSSSSGASGAPAFAVSPGGDARPSSGVPGGGQQASPRRGRRTWLIGALLAATAALVGVLVMIRPDPVPSPPVAADAPRAKDGTISRSGPSSTNTQQNAGKASAPKPGDSFRDCADGCPQMTVVPAGRFAMGSPDGEAGRYPQEGPQRAVTVAGPLAVSTYAVTFDDWDACAARGDCRKDVSDSGWGRGRRPVVNVSWDDAQSYAAWLSRTTGKPYRLLSEAEYEYVARAGARTAYPWGDAIGTGNADCDGCGSQWDNKQTAPVGSFPPNGFGLYETVGNVWSWVEDCWHDTFDHAPADASAWTSRDCQRRVVRGGGWSSNPRHLRAASRSRSTPGNRRPYTGFRVARALTP